MGSVSAALSGRYSMAGNIAGIAYEKASLLYFTGESRYNVPFFRSASATAVFPLSTGVSGFSIFRFGDRTYSEQMISLGFGHKIARYAGGVKVNLLQLMIAEQQTRYNILLEMGGLADISHRLSFGAYVYNFNAAGWSKKDVRKVKILAGVKWKPTEVLSIYTEIEKEAVYAPRIKIGGEYLLQKILSVRAGVSSNPFKNHFGAGLRYKRLLLEYGMIIHHDLGAEQILAIAFQLSSK